MKPEVVQYRKRIDKALSEPLIINRLKLSLFIIKNFFKKLRKKRSKR
jgi:hypothetical protein